MLEGTALNQENRALVASSQSLIRTVRASARMLRRELTTNKGIKSDILERVHSNLEMPQFVDEGMESDNEMMESKLIRFRPRLVGAVAAYSLLSDLSHDELISQGGMEAFYLFWALGSIQDDFIDTLPKNSADTFSERRKSVAQSIFGPDRKFYRATFFTLKSSVKNSTILESSQQDYIIGRFTEWYRFLIDQEGTVLGKNFEDLSFDICRKYREDQNTMAGKVLVAALNGNTCLDPSRQVLETRIPRLSYLTQVIDDIADLPEDLSAKRPSYAVGALIDNPGELACMQNFIVENGIKKVTPRLFRRIAPQAAKKVDDLFEQYRVELEHDLQHNGRGLSILAEGLYRYFPYIRNLLYRIKPEFANF